MLCGLSSHTRCRSTEQSGLLSNIAQLAPATSWALSGSWGGFYQGTGAALLVALRRPAGANMPAHIWMIVFPSPLACNISTLQLLYTL